MEESSNEMDDFTLSQIGDVMEMNIALGELTLSQAMDVYDVDDNQKMKIDFGNFHLKFDDVSEVEQSLSSDTISRFAETVTEDEIEKLPEKSESKNTRNNTKWATQVFNQWRMERSRETVIIPELKNFSAEDVNTYLSRFVLETRKRNGDEYPPKTLYLIVTGLLRKMREQGNIHVNFLDTKNMDCRRFRQVLSAEMKRLTAKGLGTKVKQAEPISEESERILWEKSMCGDSNSQSLLNTVFYYNCKLFGLRACDEHRNLQAEQIIVDRDQTGDYIEFRGTTAKTYAGALAHRSDEAKTLRHHSTGELPRLYSTDLSKVAHTGPFYIRPLPGKDNDNLRYSCQVIGVNKLKILIKTMCEAAGIQGYFTNHSGKRTCATRLYEEGIEEQEIMRITSHRSTEAVRKYKRPSQKILSSKENVLDPPKEKKMKSDAPLNESKMETNQMTTESEQRSSACSLIVFLISNMLTVYLAHL